MLDITKSLLGISALEYRRAIDTCIFCNLFWYLLFSDVLYIFVNIYVQVLVFSMFQWTLVSKFSRLVRSAIKWSSDPHLNNAFGFQPFRPVCLFLEFCELKDDWIYYGPYPFSIGYNLFQLGLIPHNDCTLIDKKFLFVYILLKCPNSIDQFVRQIYLNSDCLVYLM